MKIVVAPDSFKGSIDALSICNIAEKVAKDIFPKARVVKIPMADGGEGTVDSLISFMNGEKLSCTVNDPLRREINASYGVFHSTAIMEMAQASGITLVNDNDRDIMLQSTYGTGEMLLDALSKGYRKIYMGIGGSATNDAGIGFASAIGVKFLDENNNILKAVPANFEKIRKVDISDINPLIETADITIMSDVTNPLLGEKGATNVFGKQKGADEKQRLILEKAIEHYINIAEKDLGKSVREEKGAGAAGGLGSGFMLYTKAKINSGVETILELVKFRDEIYDADFVITGEGMMDYQSAMGKVAFGVGSMCKEENIPCIAIVGAMGKGAMEMQKHGIRSIIPTVNSIMELDYAMANAESLCESAIYRALSLVKIGMEFDMSH